MPYDVAWTKHATLYEDDRLQRMLMKGDPQALLFYQNRDLQVMNIQYALQKSSHNTDNNQGISHHRDCPAACRGTLSSGRWCVTARICQSNKDLVHNESSAVGNVCL